MAFTNGRSRTASHVREGGGRNSKGQFQKGSGIVIDGLDLVVQQFQFHAAAARPAAAATTVAFAKIAAEKMRQRVPVDEGDLLDSITSDDSATITPSGAYADAGPDRTANAGAFIAHIIERGSVKMGPRPFVEPAGDETLPLFIAALRKAAT